MFNFTTLTGGKPHPEVPALAEQFRGGQIDRREFLRTVAWLGVTAASAAAFAGVAPGAALAEEPKMGGVLRIAVAVQEITDPALVSWVEGSNLLRNVVEFLTKVDADNITHPFLAKSWEPSEDLKVWTFQLQPNVKWSNGDAFTTEDVVFNIKRWTDANSKSSNKSSFAAITSVDVKDTLTFSITLNRAILSIPEMFYAYTCPILHRDFDKVGAPWPKNPVGTGPYALAEYGVGQKAIFKRREGYWGKKPYLDEVRYIDLGSEISAHIAALAAGQVDFIARITANDIELVKKLPKVQLLTAHAASTVCIRMQTDQKPFDDIRVRRAVLLAADNAQMVKLAYRDLGVVGENHHVAPFQPEYFKLPAVARDVARAKALLAEAGYKDGIDLTLVLGNTQGRWEQDTAQVLQQNCAEAGIRVKLNVLPATEYWPIWNKAPFALTFWVHRPLAVMTLDLAYRSTAAWNEAHFKSPEFDAALDKAMAIVDPKQRALAMQAVEKIVQDAAIMVQPFWADKFTAASTRVQGLRLHPSDYHDLTTVHLA